MAFGKLSVDELISSNNISVTGNVSFTGNVTVGAGTASNAAISTSGDPNTGIYFPAADNIGFVTGGTIRGRWTTDGLCFGSDTAAANALDDYEEGTWDPQIYYQDAGDQADATNTTQNGYYVKIGSVVTVSGYLVWTLTGTAAGDNIGIKNLPFTSFNGDSTNAATCALRITSASSYPTAGYVGIVYNNQSRVDIETQSGLGNQGDDIGAGTRTVTFAVTYRTQ